MSYDRAIESQDTSLGRSPPSIPLRNLPAGIARRERAAGIVADQMPQIVVGWLGAASPTIFPRSDAVGYAFNAATPSISISILDCGSACTTQVVRAG
jgi:hypothetical protein